MGEEIDIFTIDLGGNKKRDKIGKKEDDFEKLESDTEFIDPLDLLAKEKPPLKKFLVDLFLNYQEPEHFELELEYATFNTIGTEEAKRELLKKYAHLNGKQHLFFINFIQEIAL